MCKVDLGTEFNTSVERCSIRNQSYFIDHPDSRYFIIIFPAEHIERCKFNAFSKFNLKNCPPTGRAYKSRKGTMRNINIFGTGFISETGAHVTA